MGAIDYIRKIRDYNSREKMFIEGVSAILTHSEWRSSGIEGVLGRADICYPEKATKETEWVLYARNGTGVWAYDIPSGAVPKDTPRHLVIFLPNDHYLRKVHIKPGEEGFDKVDDMLSSVRL